MNYLPGDQCLKILEVSKYVSNSFVCYRFILKISMDGFDDAMIAFDPKVPYVVSLISFNMSLFDKVTDFMAFYNSKDSLPTEDLIQATGLDRILQSDNQVMYNSFGVRYKVDIIQDLELPYTTRCRKAVARDHYLACVNESVVSTFNRLSPMSQHTNGSLKLMSDHLLQNTTNTEKYFDIVRDCRNMFNWNDCNILVFTSANDEKIRWNTFQVYSMLPDHPNIFIESRPRLLFMDYATLTFSCFGTWLGFSVLGLNPFKGKKNATVVPAAEAAPMRSVYQSGQKRINQLLLNTLKEQQESIAQINEESQTMKNELKKLARKIPR